MAASSSSSGLRWKYDVFINFKGEDTRKGFVSHLNKALRQKSLDTFMDAEKLRKGDRFSELLTAIRESRLSIVVLSQNYASSTWCLKELVEILKCKDTKNQIVLPIFYQDDPSDVRKLKRSFAKAFTKHERRFNVDVKEMQSWRSALDRATDLSGWNSQNYKDDAELIETIVEDVFRKLIHVSSTSSKDNNLIGMDSLMHKMHLLLNPPRVETNDVYGCSSFERLPENSEVMELSDLNFSGSEIEELPSSINNLTGLRYLNLRDCKELKSLPSTIRMKSLKTLDLYGCSSLETFPEISEVMVELSELNLSGSKIKELPSSINNLTGLSYLNLRDCKQLKSLPSTIRMTSLKTLDLHGCSSLEMFPEISEVMVELSELNLSGSKIKELPSLINNLNGLRYLNLRDCKELKSLPRTIRMKSLKTLDLYGCSSLEMFPEISEVMVELSDLNLSGSKIRELPSSINNLTGLRYLDLEDCKELKSLPSNIRLKSLETLDLPGCSSLEMFPEISEIMKELSWLRLSGSKIKELPSSINNLTRLRFLKLEDCKELKSLPSSICQLESLINVTLSGCTKFELHLDGTSVKEHSPSVERLQGLEVLNLRDCRILVHPGGCTNLSQLPVNFEDLVRLWDSAVEIDNWDTDILTRILYS